MTASRKNCQIIARILREEVGTEVGLKLVKQLAEAVAGNVSFSMTMQMVEIELKEPSVLQYFAIIGGRTQEAIGYCSSVGMEDVKKEEPEATFREISLEEYEKALREI